MLRQKTGRPAKTVSDEGPMPREMELRCRCGEVVGRVENASPQKVNRVVCYCDDCQAFAHQLGRADLLNAQGGTDIIQVAPAALTFVKGQQHITGLRLSPKGLFRFHTTCCNKPIGNTLSPAIPFVGIVAQVFDSNPKTVDGVFGAPIGAILGKYAIGKPPADSTGINLPVLLRAITKVLGWRLRGRAWPNPFFQPKTREPVYPVRVVALEQRESLRPLCGPRPAAQASAQAG